MPANCLLLGEILALSASLNLSWLTSEEYANVYYAATVKNMLDGWHDFFFASYDAGFVSVDKPPFRVLVPGGQRPSVRLPRVEPTTPRRWCPVMFHTIEV